MLTAIQKNLLLAMGFLLIAIASFGQVKSEAYRIMLGSLLSHTVPEISVPEAARASSSCLFLDAREPREYAVSHIAGAIPVGYDHFGLENLPSHLSKDRRIIVYCSVGYRSEKVSEKLRQAGYSQVSNLYGGIFEWVNQGHPVVNQTGPTKEVHAYDKSWGVWLERGKKVYK